MSWQSSILEAEIRQLLKQERVSELSSRLGHALLEIYENDPDLCPSEWLIGLFRREGREDFLAAWLLDILPGFSEPPNPQDRIAALSQLRIADVLFSLTIPIAGLNGSAAKDHFIGVLKQVCDSHLLWRRVAGEIAIASDMCGWVDPATQAASSLWQLQETNPGDILRVIKEVKEIEVEAYPLPMSHYLYYTALIHVSAKCGQGSGSGTRIWCELAAVILLEVCSWVESHLILLEYTLQCMRENSGAAWAKVIESCWSFKLHETNPTIEKLMYLIGGDYRDLAENSEISLLTSNAEPLSPSVQTVIPDGSAESASLSAGAAFDTQVEELLTSLWMEVLGVEKISVNEDFFSLGGDSIVGVRLISRASKLLGLEISVKTLFEAPTVAALAQAIGTIREDVAANPPVLRAAGLGQGPLPLSVAQERLWFLEQLDPGSGVYNLSLIVRGEGALHLPVLLAALSEVVRRHEVLRTTFRSVDGKPAQVTHAPTFPPLPLIDLSALPESAREGVWRALAMEETSCPFDLERGPLLRVLLLRLGESTHRFLATMHHIVSDSWSMNVFLRELVTLYTAISQGKASPLLELPVQYADFAAWQRRSLESESLLRQLSYWRDKLADLPPLKLTSDRPRPSGQRFEGGNEPFSLPRKLSADLRDMSQRQGVSLFMTLLAGFAALLSRYSSQEDFAIGTFVGNRNRPELEDLIGCFTNSLTLRLWPAGKSSFRWLMEQVRETALGAYAHQEVPFEWLLEKLRVDRDLSRTPLFQVTLAFQNFSAAAVEASGTRFEPVALRNFQSEFELSLWLRDGPDGIAGFLNFCTNIFDHATIARLVSHFEVLLHSAVRDPDLPLRDLPLLTSAERLQLLEWSAGSPAEPDTLQVETLFAERARISPQATALEWNGERLAYAELHRRSDILAARLRGLGVGPEVLVGLSMKRSPEMIVALLAVVKSGGAYLPLDPDYPADRLAFMIQDANVPVILTQVTAVAALPPTFARIVLVDKESPSVADRATGLLTPLPPLEDHPAYVIYTSGSTGRPKGVVVAHRSLASYTSSAIRAFGLGPEDRVLQFASISFDASAEEIFPTLASGAALVLRPEDMLSSMAHFLREVERLSITVLDLPTAFWHILVAGLGTEGELPSCVRLVIIGGEEALPERVALWRQRVGEGVRLLNTYGPTEATIVCTRQDLTEGGDEAPIGQPIHAARVYVLDRWGGMVPVGVAGELHVGGVGLARGYLRRPDVTAERFIPNTFGPPGSRLYRTGDLVRWRPSGELEFLGRVDQQIKLRGFRVELGEIETALRSHPLVRDAAVALWSGPIGDPQLVAYTVSDASAAPPADLRQFVQEHLPGFMVPSAFVELEALPLTPSGKVDRRALPRPEGERPELTFPYEAPHTELELAIAEVWRELLGIERIGLHDNFFDLGANSLLIVRALGRLRRMLGRELSLVDLFRHPSVGTLARHLSQTIAEPVSGPDWALATGLGTQLGGAETVTRMQEARAARRLAQKRRQERPE